MREVAEHEGEYVEENIGVEGAEIVAHPCSLKLISIFNII